MAIAEMWFKKIGGTVKKNPDGSKTYSGGDITRIDEVPVRWREQVRAMIESEAA